MTAQMRAQAAQQPPQQQSAPQQNPGFFPNPASLQPDMNPVLLQRNQSWSQFGHGLDDSMDFIRCYESPMDGFDGFQQTVPFSRQIPLAGLNSCLPIQQEWNDDDEFKAFFNPSPTLI
jgi:hypothetical protein